ncbi:hypothetical protein GB937_010516, partial [Aspergillus fischeri]
TGSRKGVLSHEKTENTSRGPTIAQSLNLSALHYSTALLFSSCQRHVLFFADRSHTQLLKEKRYHDERDKFFARVYEKRKWIEAIVAYHLNLGSSNSCCMDDVENWHHGSFISNRNSSLEDVFCFGSLFHIRLVMPFDLEMGTKRSGVRREPMRGFKKTVQMFLYQSYTAFLHLLVKLLLNWKTYHFLPAAFNTYIINFYHGLVVLSLRNLFVTKLRITYLLTRWWALATC